MPGANTSTVSSPRDRGDGLLLLLLLATSSSSSSRQGVIECRLSAGRLPSPAGASASSPTLHGSRRLHVAHGIGIVRDEELRGGTSRGRRGSSSSRSSRGGRRGSWRKLPKSGGGMPQPRPCPSASSPSRPSLGTDRTDLGALDLLEGGVHDATTPRLGYEDGAAAALLLGPARERRRRLVGGGELSGGCGGL